MPKNWKTEDIGEYAYAAKPLVGMRTKPEDRKFEKSPYEFLSEEAVKRGWTLQFQVLGKPQDGKGREWSFDLIIKTGKGKVVKRLSGKGRTDNQHHAKNRICTYALFRLPGWLLASRLTEPYKSDYAMWEETKKAHRQNMSRPEWQYVDHDDIDDSCSVNTGFTMQTTDIAINKTRHYSQRAMQRKVPLKQQQQCLKYGEKEDSGDGVTLFHLGHLTVVRGGPQHGDAAITVFPRNAAITVFPRTADKDAFRFVAGEKMRGVVWRIAEGKKKNQIWFYQDEEG